MLWLGLAIPLAGILWLLLGSALGAKLGGVDLWKGPAIVVAAGIAQAGLSEFVLKPITDVNNILLDYAIFFVLAVGIAYFFHVGVKATALIAIGALVFMVAFGLAAHELVGSMIER
jgi:hypothetical protein